MQIIWYGASSSFSEHMMRKGAPKFYKTRERNVRLTKGNEVKTILMAESQDNNLQRRSTKPANTQHVGIQTL